MLILLLSTLGARSANNFISCHLKHSLFNSSFMHCQHFFGPPAIGFGAGLISIHRSLPLATSIGTTDIIKNLTDNLNLINI